MRRISAAAIGLAASSLCACTSSGIHAQDGQAAADLARRYHVDERCVIDVFERQNPETQAQLARIGIDGLSANQWQTQKTLEALGAIMACPAE